MGITRLGFTVIGELGITRLGFIVIEWLVVAAIIALFLYLVVYKKLLKNSISNHGVRKPLGLIACCLLLLVISLVTGVVAKMVFYLVETVL